MGKLIPAFLALLVLFLAVGAVCFFVLNRYMSVPPGCRNTGDMGIMGGCFGKNVLSDFKITGILPECLKIKPSNCQMAGLQIENFCSSNYPVLIENESMPEKYSYPIYRRGVNGKPIHVTAATSYPQEDEPIFLNGSVGGNPFTISFTVTKAMCD